MGNLFGIETAGGNKVIPEGSHDAVLIAIVQNGIHAREYQGKELKPANMLRLIFEVPGLKRDDGQVQVLTKEIPASMNERANFFKIFKALGVFKEPTGAELAKAFGTRETVEALLGLTATLNVEHFEKNDGSKGHYIASVSKLDPRLPQPKAESETYIFTFAEPDLDIFKNKLTKFARARIMHAQNAKDLPKEFHEAYIAEQEAQDVEGGKVAEDII